MATQDCITTLLDTEDFRVNGCGTVAYNEPEHYFSSAHAVLALFTSYQDSHGTIKCNKDIQRAALGAVETMIELGMWQLYHDRKAVSAA